MKLRIKLSILFGAIFFILGIITLADYGINWDTINHLPRGQAYLNYFLTGKTDYSGLPVLFRDWYNKNDWYFQKPESLRIDTNWPKGEVPTRSFYQLESLPFSYFVNHDGNGHPPLSDILAALFNRVLFVKLRLVNDIDSYRVYGVLLASCLVGLIFYWVSKVYGNFAGFISALSLSIYPLFWAESHFNNEKDIPEAVFWSFMFFSIWKGFSQKSWRWIILSGVFLGLALGTKFNILFSVFAVIPWILYYYYPKFKELKKSVLISFLFVPVIGIAIFVVTWPYLWADPITRTLGVIKFYKDIGLGGFDVRYAGPFGISTYPIKWIIYTTPLSVLFFGVIGIIAAVKRVYYKKEKNSLLFLLWLVVPIARETWPGASFYGGIRQIMEYIPALAIFSGLGAMSVRDAVYNYSKLLKVRFRLSKSILMICISLLFLPIIFKLISIHPNENVYFNPIVGGLSGAKNMDIPYWGFSFGAPYRKGIEWINKHAEPNSKAAYAYELIPNIPRLWIRPDINFGNAFRSGYLRKGEYVITLTYQGTTIRSYYDNYLDLFQEPVYEEKVDGVAILKVWKNDDKHLKLRLKEEEAKGVTFEKTKEGLIFDLGTERKLSRLELKYAQTNCKLVVDGSSRISSDKINWQSLPGSIPDDWGIPELGVQPKNGNFIEPFIGESARYIEIKMSPPDSCLSKVTRFKLFYFL